MSNRALVLFSGGQDSTVCLAWALANFDEVETIGFDYGQRHRIELECRKTILQKLDKFLKNEQSAPGSADSQQRPSPLAGEDRWGVGSARTRFNSCGENPSPDLSRKGRGTLLMDHLVDLAALGKISETALTRDAKIAFEKNGLPNTFVPGRNLLFFTYAAAVAYRRDIENLVGGMCETDYSGYPDCRDETLKALQTAINLGTARDFKIHTPLMKLTKAATWELAQQLGGDALTDLIVNETHTCYLGERGKRHDWGFGCGECPACKLRANGYRAWREKDKAA